MEYRSPVFMYKGLPPPFLSQGSRETSSDSLQSSSQIDGSDPRARASAPINGRSSPFSSRHNVQAINNTQYAQAFFSPASGAPRSQPTVPFVSGNEEHLSMYSGTRLDNHNAHTYSSSYAITNGHRSAAGLGTGQYNNNRVDRGVLQPREHGPRDLVPAVNFATTSSLGAEPEVDAAEDDELFEEDEVGVESSESTADVIDDGLGQALDPQETVRLYDGRSPCFDPYPIPIHGNTARAILRVPLARSPKFSLLVMNPRNKHKIMKEFPPPWIPIPNNVTLFGILRGWMNHLCYETLDGFIQIKTTAPNITEFLTPETWALLKSYGICTAKPGKNESNWLQKRLDNRKGILGQAYINALQHAPKIRAPGADFGGDSKNITPSRVKKLVKSLASSVTPGLVTKRPGNEGFEGGTKQKTTLPQTPQSQIAEAARTNNASIPTKVTIAVSAKAKITALNLSKFAGNPSISASGINVAPPSTMTTTASNALPTFRQLGPSMCSVPDRHAPGSPSIHILSQPTPLLPNPSNSSLPTMPFNLPVNQPLLSFLVQEISAESSLEKPFGKFLFLDFWDSLEQYVTVKKGFVERTYKLLKLAGQMLAIDPLLSTASIPLQLESMATLVGRDIFSRPAEFLGWHAALLEKVPELSAKDAITYAFSNAFEKIMPLCLSDALEEAVYIGLLNAFGPTVHQNPANFSYKLLVDVRSSAVASVTQTQSEIHGHLQQLLQLQQASPTTFKLQRLLQTALSGSSGTLSKGMSEFLTEPTLARDTLNKPYAAGAHLNKPSTNTSLSGENVRRGLPQDGSSGFILRSGDLDVYLREDSSSSSALNVFQTPSLFPVAPVAGLKRARSSRDTDDVFYNEEPGELAAKRPKGTVPSVDRAMLTVSGDGVAPVNFNTNTSFTAVPAATFHTSNGSEPLEIRAEGAHTEVTSARSPILFRDIPSMPATGELAYLEELEDHYRGGAAAMHEQWSLD